MRGNGEAERLLAEEKDVQGEDDQDEGEEDEDEDEGEGEGEGDDGESRDNEEEEEEPRVAKKARRMEPESAPRPGSSSQPQLKKRKLPESETGVAQKKRRVSQEAEKPDWDAVFGSVMDQEDAPSSPSDTEASEPAPSNLKKKEKGSVATAGQKPRSRLPVFQVEDAAPAARKSAKSGSQLSQGQILAKAKPKADGRDNDDEEAKKHAKVLPPRLTSSCFPTLLINPLLSHFSKKGSSNDHKQEEGWKPVLRVGECEKQEQEQDSRWPAAPAAPKEKEVSLATTMATLSWCTACLCDFNVYVCECVCVCLTRSS